MTPTDAPEKTTRENWHWLALAAVFLLGVALRVWGIDFGLPYTIAPDEPTHFKIALGIFKTGDLNPHWLNYPSLTFYLNALALIPYYLVGHALGVFATRADVPPPEVVTMGVGVLSVPSEFLWSRLLTAAFGVGSLGLLYLLARQMRVPRWGAVLAALFMAVSPAAVYNSHLIRPDTFVVFFALLSVIFAVRIVDEPNLWNYIGSGIGAGLAVSSKYDSPLIGVALLAAHFARFGGAGIKRKELYLGIAAALAAFFLTTPYILLDFPLFLRGFGFEITAQAQGHVGNEGNTVWWYLWFLWNTESMLVIAAVVQAVRLVLTRSRRGLVFLSFPVAYYIFINLFIVRNDRTVLPVLPFLHLLAAMFVVALFAELTRRVRPAVAGMSTLATCALFIFFPLQSSIASDLRLTQPDGRDAARAWIEANLPGGTRLAQEAYTPYVNTQRFVAQGVYGIVDHLPEWYVENGFEYLVFSQGNYGRFFAEPDRYGDWIGKYNQFFNRFQQVKRFDGNDYEIRIYKTGVTLPPHRVAARFGDYGELIELIGYDDVQWARGDPLRVRLFWRTLGAKPEPFEVELRLLGENDQEIAAARSDLFQGKGWRAGMFDSIFALTVPADVSPGEYRIQVNVIWTRFAYALPAYSWAEQRIDPVLLQPIEMKPE